VGLLYSARGAHERIRASKGLQYSASLRANERIRAPARAFEKVVLFKRHTKGFVRQRETASSFNEFVLKQYERVC